jgi:hypothetical protein
MAQLLEVSREGRERQCVKMAAQTYRDISNKDIKAWVKPRIVNIIETMLKIIA